VVPGVVGQVQRLALEQLARLVDAIRDESRILGDRIGGRVRDGDLGRLLERRSRQREPAVGPDLGRGDDPAVGRQCVDRQRALLAALVRPAEVDPPRQTGSLSLGHDVPPFAPHQPVRPTPSMTMSTLRA
jgi:hypothetical protein